MKRSIIWGGFMSLVLLLAAGANAQDGTVREIKGGIVNGKALSLPKPEYTDEFRAEKLAGTVRIDVVIDENGTVIFAEPSKEEAFRIGRDGTAEKIETEMADPRLVESARAAALNAKFSPTALGGVPVRVRGILSYNFTAASHINGGVLNGKAISLPRPVYPPAGTAVKAAGAVNVKITIDEEGFVESAEAVSGHPLLRASAVDAARSARFSPTKLGGNPVKVTGIIVYNFVP